MFLKNRNIISKIKRSKVTDYAALREVEFLFSVELSMIFFYNFKACLSVVGLGSSQKSPQLQKN